MGLTLDHCTESGGGPTAWPGQSTRVIIRPALPQSEHLQTLKGLLGPSQGVPKGLCRFWCWCWLALCVWLSPFQNGGTWWCCHWLHLRSADLKKSREIDPSHAKADFCRLFSLKLNIVIEQEDDLHQPGPAGHPDRQWSADYCSDNGSGGSAGAATGKLRHVTASGAWQRGGSGWSTHCTSATAGSSRTEPASNNPDNRWPNPDLPTSP